MFKRNSIIIKSKEMILILWLYSLSYCDLFKPLKSTSKSVSAVLLSLISKIDINSWRFSILNFSIIIDFISIKHKTYDTKKNRPYLREHSMSFWCNWTPIEWFDLFGQYRRNLKKETPSLCLCSRHCMDACSMVSVCVHNLRIAKRRIEKRLCCS